MVGVGGLDSLGGAQLLSASVSWAPTAGGHTARQPLPSPSHLESTHETHAARRGLAAGRGRCEKRTSHAPLAHARASPGEVGSIFPGLPERNVMLALNIVQNSQNNVSIFNF